MADKNENTLTLFTTRVRQMILQYKEVKAENRSLQVKLDERDEEINLLKGQIDQLRSDYDMLKIRAIGARSYDVFKIFFAENGKNGRNHRWRHGVSQGAISQID